MKHVRISSHFHAGKVTQHVRNVGIENPYNWQRRKYVTAAGRSSTMPGNVPVIDRKQMKLQSSSTRLITAVEDGVWSKLCVAKITTRYSAIGNGIDSHHLLPLIGFRNVANMWNKQLMTGNPWPVSPINCQGLVLSSPEPGRNG